MLDKSRLRNLEGFGNKSAENLIEAIENSKIISFSKFIYGLGIKNVGEHISKLFETYFLSDLNAFMKASIKELESMMEWTFSKEVVAFWSQEVNIATVNNCLKRV